MIVCLKRDLPSNVPSPNEWPHRETSIMLIKPDKTRFFYELRQKKSNMSYSRYNEVKLLEEN